MKRLLLFLMVLILASNLGQTAEKRILLEQYTGAWCGWCVDGTLMLDSLIKKYPNQIIGVRQHTGDGMATEQSQDLFSAFGSDAGVPTATINRLDFTGKVPSGENPFLTNRSIWFSLVKTILTETPASDVLCSWYYDESTKLIKGLVTSSLLKELPYQQALNIFITENNVTGTGELFDQKNYYSGLQGSEKHPYYKKPSVIVGYQHNKVARYQIGGLWGEKLNIKKPGHTGETYQWSFCVEVPKSPVGNPVNINNVELIGVSLIDEPNLSDILNCVKGVKESPKTTFLYSTNGYTHFINDKVTIKMKIDNFTEIDNDYDITIEYLGYGAKNWLVNVEKSAFAINAGKSAEFNVDVTPKGEGMRKFRVVLKDKDNKMFNSFCEITVYNTNSEKIIVTDQKSSSTSSNLDELVLANYNDFISFSDYQYNELIDSFPQSKLVVFDFSDKTALSNSSPEQFNSITNNGKKLFVIGNGIAALTKSNPKLLTFWSSMGFRFNEQYTKFDDLVNETMSISGYNGDPISDATKYTLVTPAIHKNFSTFGIIDYDKARPVYSITQDPNSIITFRTLMNNQRALISAFNFFNIKDEEQRMDFINKSINWLMNGGVEEQAHLTVSAKDLNFKLVELGKSDTMDIVFKNIGTKSLQLSSQNVVSETSEFFAVQTMGYKSLLAGDSVIYQIRFTPNTKVQAKGYFYLKTNDAYRDSIAVTLTGKGRTSVEDDLQIQSSIKTSPNPVTNSATITVLFENNIQNVSLNLIDIEGRLIKNITKGDFLKGSYTYDLTTVGISSGSYFIQITNDISTLCQPIIIDK